MHTARNSLARIVGAIQASEGVESVWIGGSVRDGTGDDVSDLDLWVKSDHWDPASLGGILLAGTILDIGGPLFHGVDVAGVMVDLRYGPNVPPEYDLLDSIEAEPWTPAELEEAGPATDFWINTYKHRKPLWRNLDGLVGFGLPFDRQILFRSWVSHDLCSSLADLSFTIHSMSAYVRDHMTPERMAILGLPTGSRREILETILAFRREMLKISQPSRLTQMVTTDPVFREICEGSGLHY